jgi:protein-disulfide isomerase
MSTFIPVGASDHTQGNPQAPITLLEYGDYECPYCGAAYPILKKLQAHYGDKLRFVFRNFPLSDVHPHAMMAAYTAEGSALQGKFWEVHDLIYEHQKSLSEQVLLNLAKSAGVNVFQL